MKNKDLYIPPVTETVPVAVEVNIMSYPGGVPNYNYHDPSDLGWEE